MNLIENQKYWNDHETSKLDLDLEHDNQCIRLEDCGHFCYIKIIKPARTFDDLKCPICNELVTHCTKAT